MGLIRCNWIWILVILGAIVAFAAFRLNRNTEPEYFTAKVEKGDIRQVIDATGTINPEPQRRMCESSSSLKPCFWA